MSRRAPSLDGTEHYAYGYSKNSPTKLQGEIINDIQTVLGISFSGETSEDAYEFIGKHHQKMINERRRRRGW